MAEHIKTTNSCKIMKKIFFIALCLICLGLGSRVYANAINVAGADKSQRGSPHVVSTEMIIGASVTIGGRIESKAIDLPDVIPISTTTVYNSSPARSPALCDMNMIQLNNENENGNTRAKIGTLHEWTPPAWNYSNDNNSFDGDKVSSNQQHDVCDISPGQKQKAPEVMNMTIEKNAAS